MPPPDCSIRFENGGRIGQGLVQKEPVKVVAQVVMGQDVGPAARRRIPAQKMAGPVQRLGQAGPARFHGLEDRFVEQQDANHRRQVPARPEPFHIGFRRAQRSAQSDPGVKARMMHTNRPLQRTDPGEFSEGRRSFVFNQRDPTVPQFSQLIQYKPSGDAIHRPRPAHLRCRGFEGDDVCFHGEVLSC